ncbi:MAG TPA: CHAT domain-containing protein, partial [Candidatus Kapabacteria bacterium]|nr:CHAT domain-containing protein [Candidatus Kapabacteria bacterium]
YNDLGAKDKALGYYEKALAIHHAVGDAGEATTFSNLMALMVILNNKQMAIFYGKQSVNGYQQLRENIATLDKEIKHSYLKTEKDTYRFLINLLISQRRLDEALLVLDMLKAEEYYQFIQKDNSSPLPNRQYQPLEFTTFEQQWLQKYNNIMENIASVSNQYHELLMAKPKNETERNRLTALDNQLNESNNTYNQFLLQLKDAFTEYDQKVKKGEYERLNLAAKSNSIQSILRDLDKTEGGKNVTLHYFVFDNKIQIILTTPTFQTVQSSTIDEEKLSTLIGQYQAAINYSRSRGVTLLPQSTIETAPLTSTELYDLIFKPIEKDLKDYGAVNIMVYLDGVLRYIPLPVLFDGQNYLVQRYRISVLTTSSLLNIKEEPVQKLKILGMAAGKGSAGISSLPNARAEIRNIVRDTSSGCNGFIDGKALLDEVFTKTSMFQQLKTFSFPLVHIASHFNFSSENETQNYLMLGDSSKLTLKDIRLEGNLFHNVDMLVLAACQTAMGNSYGVEIDSFGELAQKSGAKSVVASLWVVNDKSSKDLMVSFYRNIKEHRFSSKIEALRQAQLELAGLEDLLNINNTQTNQSVSQDKKYSNPYYWGPFIMMGNWR